MKNILLDSFPIIETERLLLRELSMDDSDAIFELRSDDSVNRFLGRPPAQSLTDARNFILKIRAADSAGESLYWAICLKGNKRLVGTIVYWNISPVDRKAEIGYELLPLHSGKGYMTEALAAVLEFGFAVLGFRRIEAFTMAANQASSKLLEKSGFQRDHNAKTEIPGEIKYYRKSGPVPG